MLKIKRDINQHDFLIVEFILLNLNNFQSLEVVDSTSETQFQMSENLNLLI